VSGGVPVIVIDDACEGQRGSKDDPLLFFSVGRLDPG